MITEYFYGNTQIEYISVSGFETQLVSYEEPCDDGDKTVDYELMNGGSNPT